MFAYVSYEPGRDSSLCHAEHWQPTYRWDEVQPGNKDTRGAQCEDEVRNGERQEAQFPWQERRVQFLSYRKRVPKYSPRGVGVVRDISG